MCAELQESKHAVKRINFSPTGASVSSFPVPSCWNTIAFLWRGLGTEGLPEPAPRAPGTPASACGAPAHTVRPDSLPGAPWSGCAPPSRGTRTHGACPTMSKLVYTVKANAFAWFNRWILLKKPTVLRRIPHATLHHIPWDSVAAGLEQHVFPHHLCPIHFLFRSCQTQAEPRPLRPSTDWKWVSSEPLQIQSQLLLDERRWWAV